MHRDVLTYMTIPDGLDYIEVEGCSLLKGLVERDLTQLTSHGSLGKLDNCIGCILDPIGCLLCIHDLGLHTATFRHTNACGYFCIIWF